MMAMNYKRGSEKQHLAPTVVVLGGVAHLCFLLFAISSGSSGGVVQAKILLHLGHSWRSQSFPAQVSQSPPGSTEVRTHEMAFSEGPRVWLVLFSDAVQKVQRLLAEDCQVGKIEDESTRMPAVRTRAVTLAADPQLLPHRQLLPQNHQPGSWQLVCPRPQ